MELDINIGYGNVHDSVLNGNKHLQFMYSNLICCFQEFRFFLVTRKEYNLVYSVVMSTQHSNQLLIQFLRNSSFLYI
jgi:hypothetical protein